MILFLIRIGLIFILNNQFVENLSCKYIDGNNVPYMIVYKPPDYTMIDTSTFGSPSRYGYLYKREDRLDYLKFSQKEIGDPSSIIAKTLEEVYSNPNDFYFIMYNNQVPDGVDPKVNSKNKGKSKVLVWKGDEAIWLLHSVPKFPPSFHNRQYSYPFFQNEAHNFLCISIRNEGDIRTILSQLMKMNAQIYADNLPPDINLQHLESLETKSIVRLSTQVHNNPVVVISKRKMGKIKKNSPENTLWKMVKEVYGEISIWIKTSYLPSKDKLTLYDSKILKGGKTNPLYKGKCKGIGYIFEMKFKDRTVDLQHIRSSKNIPYDLFWPVGEDSSNWGICPNNKCYCHSDKLNYKNDRGMAVCIHSGSLASYYYQDIKSLFCKRKWSLF